MAQILSLILSQGQVQTTSFCKRKSQKVLLEGKGETGDSTNISSGHKAGKGETATEGVDGITTAVEGTAIADVPKFKSKNLDVLFEFEKTKQKPTANFVVIGESFLLANYYFTLC